MAHATAPHAPDAVLPTDPSARAMAEPVAEGAGATLWLLGLTALALMFSSLLSLGFVIRGGFDGAAEVVLAGYVILIGGLGAGAFAYVVVVGRRLGLITAGESKASADTAVARAPDELRVAPRVPPRTALPGGMASWPRLRVKPVRPRALVMESRRAPWPAPLVRPQPDRSQATALQVHVAALRSPAPRQMPPARLVAPRPSTRHAASGARPVRPAYAPPRPRPAAARSASWRPHPTPSPVPAATVYVHPRSAFAPSVDGR